MEKWILLRVEVLVGPPGCGKTSELVVEMTAVPGRYVFALPTIDLIAEKLKDLKKQMGEVPKVSSSHHPTAVPMTMARTNERPSVLRAPSVRS